MAGVPMLLAFTLALASVRAFRQRRPLRDECAQLDS
jgi:hypothetical protein